MALLCLLAVRGEVRRDEVVDLLWREVDEAKARNAFRQALHRLRTALGDALLPPDRERVRLVRSPALTVDLDQYDQAVSARKLETAAQVYAGDFLEKTELGEPAFDMWAERERTRLQAGFRQLLQDLTAQHAAAGRSAESIASARRLLALAPFDAAAAHLAATTLVSSGRRVEATDVLRQFGSRLQAELGLPLPPELQAMATRLDRQVGTSTSAGTASGVQALAPLPFVGRDPELARLLALWRSVGDDSGAFALIEGGVGAGKSRLVAEFSSNARALGRTLTLAGRERSLGGALPLGIFAEALRPLVHAPGVSGASRHLLAEAARLLPELRDSFDLPTSGPVEDEAARVRFFEGIAALVDAAAYEQPVLLVLEDLHAIAPSSLDLLSYLAPRLAGSPVMFVSTVRPDDAPAAVLARLRSLGDTERSAPHGERSMRCTVGDLTTSDSLAVIGDAARRLGIPDDAAGRIALRSGGNPGRLYELLRLAATGARIDSSPVPVADILIAKLGSLTSAQRRFFVVVALIGRRLGMRLAGDAAHVSRAAARETMLVLLDEGLVVRVGDEEYEASEPAARLALDGAGAASRSFLAGWIAESLDADPSASAAELARFHALAGNARHAYASARRAAFDALAMGAAAEAIQFMATARTFANTAEEQADVDRFLDAVGAGRRLLPSGHAVPRPSYSGDADPTPSGADPARAPGALERLFPNWRILFGAAVGTLVLSALVLATRPSPGGVRSFTDTLVLVDDARRSLVLVTETDGAFSATARIDAPPGDPPWVDSIARPWADPIAAPTGQHVALSRVGTDGSELFVVGSDRRDTIPVASGAGDSRPLAWSPDGRWLLAAVRSGRERAAFDVGLWVLRVGGVPALWALDTTAGRAVSEAAWSPDGSRIAWVSRVGPTRQLEVFVSNPDGGNQRNVSRHPADDYRIAWSSDGELLAYTSTRDGNAELYAFGVRESRHWRLTRNAGQDDHATFARNGRLVAFESTRGASAGIYVMPGLGGEARRVGDAPLRVATWWSGRNRYVDRVRVLADGPVGRGETTTVRATVLDQQNGVVTPQSLDWLLLDTALATLVVPADSAPGKRLAIGRRPGLARVVASFGPWRADTAFVLVGDQPVRLIERVAGTLRGWLVLGIPAPAVTARGGSILLNADRQWDSGILSQAHLPLMPGLSVSVALNGPFGAATDPATTVTVALVAPEDESTVQREAPQFLRYASFSWTADAGRFAYAVGSESHTDPEPPGRATGSAQVGLEVDADSTVRFLVDGRERWRSTLRVLGGRNEPRVQLWIGGRATADRFSVQAVSAVLRP